MDNILLDDYQMSNSNYENYNYQEEELKRIHNELLYNMNNPNINPNLSNDIYELNNAYNLAQRAYEVSVNRFASGQTSAIELSDVSSALYQMDMSLLNAKYNILMSAESVKKLGE